MLNVYPLKDCLPTDAKMPLIAAKRQEEALYITHPLRVFRRQVIPPVTISFVHSHTDVQGAPTVVSSNSTGHSHSFTFRT